MKYLTWLWIILGVLGLGVIYKIVVPKSKNRYLSYIVQQAPSLIGRYFA